MLIDAAHRAIKNDVAAFALLVDAKNEQAVAFYEHPGFKALTSQPRTLFVARTTAKMAAPDDF